METSIESQMERALKIVGPEDFASDGETGSLLIEGAFATAIIEDVWSSPEFQVRNGLVGQPVKLMRNGGLEISCHGLYVEGRGVRSIIHRVVRNLQIRNLMVTIGS